MAEHDLAAVAAAIDPAAMGKVAVLLGGRSAEREVSLMSGEGVLAALRARGVDAHPFDPAERALQDLAREGFARAFVALHGRYGEDGTVQGALELLGVPYTGSGVMASAVAMDKPFTKRIWSTHGLPTPGFLVARSAAEVTEAADRFGLPLAVKPSREGSSIGFTKLTDRAQAAAAYALAARHDEVLCEQFVAGRELTIAILGTGQAARSLPVIEIVAPAGNYDYQNKYFRDDTRYLCPASLDDRGRGLRCSASRWRPYRAAVAARAGREARRDALEQPARGVAQARPAAPVPAGDQPSPGMTSHWIAGALMGALRRGPGLRVAVHVDPASAALMTGRAAGGESLAQPAVAGLDRPTRCSRLVGASPGSRVWPLVARPPPMSHGCARWWSRPRGPRASSTWTGRCLRASGTRRLQGNFFTVDLEKVRDAFEQVPLGAPRQRAPRLAQPPLVAIEEHRPFAAWSDGRFLNAQGELFAVQPGRGRGGRSAAAAVRAQPDSEREVLRKWRELAELLSPLGARPRALSLSPRQAWSAELDNGMALTLGRDQGLPTRERVERFVRAWPEMSARVGVQPVSVDLRYPNGFAIRLAESAAAKSSAGAAGGARATTKAPARGAGAGAGAGPRAAPGRPQNDKKQR
jgi:D-alanine-D-alanine ligase